MYAQSMPKLQNLGFRSQPLFQQMLGK